MTAAIKKTGRRWGDVTGVRKREEGATNLHHSLDGAL